LNEINPVHNACVITARFLVSLDFLFPSLFAPEKESQGSLLFLALFCFQGAVLSSDSFNIISLPNAFVNTFSKIFLKFFRPPRSAVILLYHHFLILSTKIPDNFFRNYCAD